MPAMPLEPDPSDWMEAAIDQIALLARTRISFTADDLRPLICEPHHHNQYGAAFRSAAARDLIMHWGYQRSATRSRRGGALIQWTAHPSLKRSNAA